MTRLQELVIRIRAWMEVEQKFTDDEGQKVRIGMILKDAEELCELCGVRRVTDEAERD